MSVLFALLAAAGFAAANVCTRRATLWGPPVQGTRLTIVVALPVLALMAALLGEMGEVARLPWQVYALFGAAGVVHFIVGRFSYYSSVQALGAARATVVTSAFMPLTTIVIAILVLDETFTWLTGLGALLVTLGPIVMAQGERQPGNPDGAAMTEAVARRLRHGALFGALAAVCWGTTPVLVKLALRESDLPVLGLFLSYSAALLVVALNLTLPAERRGFTGMVPEGLRWYTVVGLVTVVAQWLHYQALSVGAAIPVILLLQSVPLFVIVFTILMNRRLERVTPAVVLGSVLVMAGAAIIALS
jgi:drug/metabolite transporter (DMT)-like permease